MSIPTKLKEKKIWTLSNTEKIPLDIGILYTSGEEVPFSQERKSLYYTYDVCKKVQKIYSHTKITIHATSDIPLTLVDIEKEGNIETNPFKYLDFIYLEKSTNGGLHGLLNYKIEKMNQIIKDNDFQTEFFNDNHFMIITEDEIELPESKYQLFDFQEKLIKPKQTEYHVTKPSMIDLPEIEKSLIRKQIYVKPYSVASHQDTSLIEYKYMIMLGRKLRKKFKYQNIDQFIKHLMYACELHLPYRDKHYQVINSHDFGEVTKREYSIMKAATYLYE